MTNAAVISEHPSAAPHHRPSHRRPYRADLLSAALVVECLAVAAQLGSDGSLAGRIIRVCAVALAGAAGLAGLTLGRHHTAPRGLLCLVFGMVGTTLGAGLVLHRLAWRPLIALLTGVALLVCGAGLLTRLLRRWWRLLAIPLGLALVIMAVFPLTLAVYATNVPRSPGSHDTPASVGLRYASVWFPTADGATLAAWYVPSSNGAAVVLVHGSGSGSTKSSVLRQAGVIARAGFGVLLVDARGHGSSSGDAMDFGWYGERDISAAVAYLAARPGVDPRKIGVVGESMGGEEAIGAAGADPRVAAVVAEGATGRTSSDHGWLPGGLAGALQRGIDFTTYGVAELLTSAPRPPSLRSAIVAAAPRHVLLIAAGNVADESSAARYLQAASPATVSLWVVPGAGHTQGVTAAPNGWSTHVVGFLRRELQPSVR